MNTRTAWMALLMLALLLAGPARAAVTASVDRDRITLSESFSLEIRVDDMLNSEEPALAPLMQDFEILGTQRSSSFTLGSGGRQSSTTWQVELMPRREGELLIPAIRVGKESTRPIRITVGADPRSARTTASDVMLEVETDLPEVHVQQQLLLTVRVLHAVDLSRGATLEPPVIADAVLRELDEKSFEKTIDGRRFGVFERRYAVFPQKSGELRIPSMAFEASVGGGGSIFDRLSSRARRVRLHSEEKRIRVLPPEPGATPWLPARVLTLIETWDRSPQELRVGDSATRTVTISATGLTGAQLPPLPVPAVPGLRFYADQPRIEDAQQPDGLSGTRVESSAVIPERAGEIEFPEVKLRWWDTANARFDEAVIPRRMIRVLPASGAATAPAASAAPAPASALPEPAAAPDAADAPANATGTAGQPWPWIIATLLLALATAFTSVQWWRAMRRVPHAAAPAGAAAHDSREVELFAALAEACRAADVPRLQALLPRWGRLAYPHASVRSAGDVAAAAGDAALAAELEHLLASRYAPQPGTADGGALLRHLERARAAVLARRKCEPGSGALPPLYRDLAGSAGAEPLSG